MRQIIYQTDVQASGEARETRELCLREVYEEWWRGLSRYAKISTRQIYRYVWLRYLAKDFAELAPSAIDEAMMQGYMARHRNLSDGTLRNHLTMLRAILCFSQTHYHTNISYHHFRLPPGKRKKPPVNYDDYRRLQEVVLQDDRAVAGCIAIACFMGLRIGEICALRREDVDTARRLLYVRHTVQRVACSGGRTRTRLLLGSPKSASSYRVIPIPKILREQFNALCKNKEPLDFIFGCKEKILDPRTLQYRFKRYLAELAIPYFNFHQLRHNFATRCVEQRMDIKALSEILGHSEVSTTLDLYVHPSMEFKRRQLDRLTKD